jgi:hypothetical protein
MDNTNNTYTPASADQIHVSAMNKGCTEEGAKLVVEILTENPYLDSEAVIKEVAGAKTSDKDEVVAKVTKKAESDDKVEEKKTETSHRRNF